MAKKEKRNLITITIEDKGKGSVSVECTFKDPANLMDPEYIGTPAERLAVDLMVHAKDIKAQMGQ